MPALRSKDMRQRYLEPNNTAMLKTTFFQKKSLRQNENRKKLSAAVIPMDMANQMMVDAMFP